MSGKHQEHCYLLSYPACPCGELPVFILVTRAASLGLPILCQYLEKALREMQSGQWRLARVLKMFRSQKPGWAPAVPVLTPARTGAHTWWGRRTARAEHICHPGLCPCSLRTARVLLCHRNEVLTGDISGINQCYPVTQRALLGSKTPAQAV